MLKCQQYTIFANGGNVEARPTHTIGQKLTSASFSYLMFDNNFLALTTDLAALIPATKHETEKASALVKLGYPEVESAMPKILEWLQDRNWPVGFIFQPFLVRIGQPLAPYIRTVFVGQDDVWKYNLLIDVVAQSIELAETLRPELGRFATNPSAGESKEEVDLIAIEILDALRNGAPET